MLERHVGIITKNSFLFEEIKSWIYSNFVLRKEHEALEKDLDGYEYEIMLLKDKITTIRKIINETKGKF